MKQAIMVGAGNIGRGFIGAILANGSYHVTFADVNMELIGALNEEKQYCVHVQDKNPRTFCVTDVDGVSSAGDALVEPICTAQLITTAVGLRIPANRGKADCCRNPCSDERKADRAAEYRCV